MILLATAMTVILYMSGNIDILEGITRTQISESQKQLVKNQCLAGKPEACEGSTGKAWATKVTYDGKTCMKWAEEQNVFGPGGKGAVPEC